MNLGGDSEGVRSEEEK